MSPKVRVTDPSVIEFAEQHKVDLSTVTASAEDGRVSRADAFRAAITDRLGLDRNASNETIVAVAGYVHASAERHRAAMREREAARAAVAAPVASAGHVSDLRRAAASRGPKFAMNALVDEVRAQATAQQPAPTTPPPTLFASGDLPSFTASGIPPEALLEAPWDARHAMAAAPTAADAYAILNASSGAPSATNADQEFDWDLHPGNADYRARVEKWCADSVTDEQMEAAFAASPFGAKVVEAEKAAGIYGTYQGDD